MAALPASTGASANIFFSAPPSPLLILQGTWQELVVRAHQDDGEGACHLTPVACRLLQKHMPGRQLAGFSGCQVKYSAMSADAVVMPHTGLTDARLRLHIPLQVPVQRAGVEWWMRVGNPSLPGASRQWEEGIPTVIDDSFEHEVWTTPVAANDQGAGTGSGGGVRGSSSSVGDGADNGGAAGMKKMNECSTGNAIGNRVESSGRCTNDGKTDTGGNNSNHRIVLIVDLWHPDLDEDTRARLSKLRLA